MNKHFVKVQSLMKPKVAPFGFKEEELKEFAESISEKFKDDDELDETKVNAEIDAVIPMLKTMQAAVNRIVGSRTTPTTPKPQETQTPTTPPAENPEIAALKELIATQTTAIQNLQTQVTTFQSERQSSVRKAEYDKVLAKLKDVMPKQYEARMKNFDRLNFADDNAFTQFITDETAELEGIIQEFTERGLSFTPPTVPNTTPKDPLAEAIAAGTKAIVDANNAK